jgi:hypothetical protein
MTHTMHTHDSKEFRCECRIGVDHCLCGTPVVPVVAIVTAPA